VQTSLTLIVEQGANFQQILTGEYTSRERTSLTLTVEKGVNFQGILAGEYTRRV
jgi:hypothetical protein